MKTRLALRAAAHLMFTYIHALAATLYVDAKSANPVAPYAGWSTAATTIQDAVDASSDGDLILVTNGVYQTGGQVVYGNAMNRVAVTKPVTVLSVNGPGTTTILGAVYPYFEYGTRCAYLTNGVTLAGFTLSSGEVGFGADYHNFNGGGVYAESGAVISNCVVSGNSIYTAGDGGGDFGGTLVNCNISGNSVPEGTDVTTVGGGAYEATLINCVVFDNSSGGYGGGAHECTLNNCTVAGNYAAVGGGTSFCTVNNSIVCFNSNNQNYGYYPNYIGGGFDYCCTSPDPGGTENIVSDPGFVDLTNDDFNLLPISPCINSGDNSYVTTATDLNGNPRIVGGTVDIGACEYQTPVSRISYAWLQQYGLAITTNIDTADLDGAAFNVYQDWIAGLNPTDPSSVLAMFPPVPTNSPAGFVVSWQSVSNRTYIVQSSTNLAVQPAFTTIQTNIAGQSGTTSYTDTNAVGNGPFFYRVCVQN